MKCRDAKESSYSRRVIYLRRKEQPSVRRAFPPVGWQRTVEHPAQMTTVWAWEKTVVMVKHPGHLTSMKKDLGAGTRFYSTSQFMTFSTDIKQPKLRYGLSYLELVAASLSGWGWSEKIDGENL